MHLRNVSKCTCYALIAGVLLLTSTIVLLYKLGHEPFTDYDEATYAEVTTESLAHGNYISLTYLDAPYWRKPPLLIWINDIDTKIFAPTLGTEFAMRLSSALAAVGSIAIVMLLCYEIGGGEASLLAGGILATTTAFMEPARQVRFDILVSLFIIATFYAFLRAVRTGNKKWYLAAGIFFGLAILSKDVIAAFAGVASLCYSIFSRDFHFLRQKYFWFGALVSLAIVLPWHLYETFRFGAEFWKSYLGAEVFSRVATDIFGVGVGPSNSDYVSYFLSYAAPWSELLLLGGIAFAALWKNMDRVRRDVCLASLVTIVLIIGVMLNSQTKALSYLIPLYPFLAIFLTLIGSEIWNRFLKHAQKDEQRATVAIVVVAFLFCAYSTSINVLHVSPYYTYEGEYASEEQKIGEDIRASGPNPLVYTNDDLDMGSILYYSQLTFTPNKYVYLLSTSSQPLPGAMVFTESTLQEMSSALPQFSFTPLYQGTYVSLFGVSPQTLGSVHK